jgi:hypothetical protein
LRSREGNKRSESCGDAGRRGTKPFLGPVAPRWQQLLGLQLQHPRGPAVPLQPDSMEAPSSEIGDMGAR